MRHSKASARNNRPKLSLRQKVHRLPSRLSAWLLRCWYWANRSARLGRAGFVLPTTVLLLLMVSLTVGALSYRSFTRASQTIAYRDQQIVDEIALPAVDRAKAKLEYLFTQDPRVADKRPPSSDDLVGALLADAGTANDAYTLPDETQLDYPDAAGTRAPIWQFNFQGTQVVYSLALDDSVLAADRIGSGSGDLSIDSNDTGAKASNLITRNGPLNAKEISNSCPIGTLSGNGWYDVNSSSLEKNIQVDVLAIRNDGQPNRTVSASEYQQVRSAAKGNKWGAWFRYDLEIFPGPNFRWNGAMHTEGSLMTEQSLQAYLVSAPNSCISDASSSEITMVSRDPDSSVSGDVGFTGQVVGGGMTLDDLRLKWSNSGTDVRFHRIRFNNAATPTPELVKLDKANNATDTQNDSISVLSGGAPQPSEIALEPVKVLTEDFSAHRVAPATAGWQRIPGWDGFALSLDKLNGDGRVQLDVNNPTRPFVDDAFRADDRYGPRPSYSSTVDLAGNVIGAPIASSDSTLVAEDPVLGNFGLDGYWERRARYTGLRAIVGQRLELGNPNGWAADDPLYPVNSLSTLTNGSTLYKNEYEVRQQRSLRDNLAAVQGMVVYHATKNNDGREPYMCVAATSHPGTLQSLTDSRTFTQYGKTSAWEINFLDGHGTNGWEFNLAASGTPSFTDFATTTDMGKVLRNLAYFAGDPAGGAPSFPLTQNTVVHPYPYLSMWGDFSILRRVFTDEMGTASKAYTDLSPADQATLHSAACTMGMLAYNLESLKAEYTDIVADPVILDAIGDELVTLGIVTATEDSSQKWINDLNGTTLAYKDEARLIAQYRQVVRDRKLGFSAGNTDSSGAICTTADFSTATAANQTALVKAFCSSNQPPTYPSLFYLFPEANHGQDGTGAQVQPSGEEYISEGGVGTTYISTVNTGSTLYQAVEPSTIDLTPATAVSSFLQPTVASPSNVSFTDTTTLWGTTNSTTQRRTFSENIIDENGTLRELAFLDKAMMDGREMLSSRVMDMDVNKLTTTNVPSTTTKWIPEENGVFYAFREDAVREDAIVRPKQSGASWGGAGTDCSPFAALANPATTVCHVDVTPTNGAQEGTFDPPINPNTGISPKPVDMAPDPDRRTHGFRLFNGASFGRSSALNSAGLTFTTDNVVYIKGDFNLHEDSGTSGLTDYLEEFDTKIQTTAFVDTAEATARTNFYGRTNLNAKFAQPASDSWRPAEILADSASILSNTFLDGWIEDAYTVPQGSGVGSPVANSSYLNFNRPIFDSSDGITAASWIHENASDDTSPIKVDRNGVIGAFGGGVFPSGVDDYISFYERDGSTSLTVTRRKEIAQADLDGSDTRVNALLVAGVVPSRAGQSYGGLHNMPRLLEYWRNSSGSLPLFMSGGFFQLNFSTQGTAPFDQDTWLPTESPTTGNSGFVTGQARAKESIQFYDAPMRVWGYDVALQYTAAAPIAQRFVTVGRPRSEFFRELPIDD
ncbi:MAG: hormogonium polysaccharide biosynthesis protein HpsA, partial [Cyanobacteria bacterium J06632_22]